MRAPVVALLLLSAAAPLAAQSARPRFLTGFEYYTLSFDSGIGTKSVSELIVPLGISLPLSPRFSIDAGTYFISASRTDQGDTTTTLSGLTDVLLRVAYQLKPDVATLTFALNLPTGRTELTQQELEIAGKVATDLVPFPVSNFGAGFSATTGLAVAIPAGAWAIGFGGSFRYNSEYTPLADSALTPLTPGSEFRLRLGADRLIGQGRLTMGLTYSTFSQDEFGANKATPGGRVISQMSLGVPVGNGSLSFFAWDIHRLKGDSTAGLPGIKENTLALGVMGAFRMGGNVLRPSLEIRQAWAGDSALASAGTLFGVGVRYQIGAGRRVVVVPGLRFDLGTVPVGTTSVGYTGFSGSLSVRIGL